MPRHLTESDDRCSEVYDESYEDWRKANDYLYKPSVAVFLAGLLGIVVSLCAVLGALNAWRLWTR